MNTRDSQGSATGLNASELAASLTVNDLSASTGWYQDIFGFTIDRRHEREGKLIAVSFRAGQVRLLLTQDDGDDGQHDPDGSYELSQLPVKAVRRCRYYVIAPRPRR